MTTFVLIFCFAVPCVLGAWLWWSMRENGGNRTSYKSRRVSHSPQRFGKIQGETTHKDYTDGSAQSKSDPPKVPLYNGEPLKVTPLGDNRKAQTETTLVDRVERPPRDYSHALKAQHEANAQYSGMTPAEKPSEGLNKHNSQTLICKQHKEINNTFRFIKGERYLLESGTVYECMGFKGIKNRRVAFSDYGFLEYWPEKRNRHPDYFDWFSIRYDGDVETCDRGRIRSDCVASNHEADSYAKLLKDRFDGEREYWAKRKEKRERDEKRLKQLERLVKENGLE